MSDLDGFDYMMGTGSITTVEGVVRRRAKRVPFGFRAPEVKSAKKRASAPKRPKP